MRGVRYIHEQPDIGRRRRNGIPFEPVVVGGIALALGIVAWAGLQSPKLAPEVAAIEASAAPLALAGLGSGKLDAGTIVRDCAACPEMVVVPTGYYVIGAPDDDPVARPQEKPRRGGSLMKPIAVGRYEVTVAEYTAFLGETSGAAPACAGATRGPDQPQNCVTWQDAQAYVQWLSAKTGSRYRLPGADEWEYAAKAHGLGAVEPNGRFQLADAPVRVGDTQANGFGLFGMGGNVAELAVDCWIAPAEAAPVELKADGSCAKRTVKDASWLDSAAEARPTAKRAIRDDLRSERVGFRVFRDLTVRERGD